MHIVVCVRYVPDATDIRFDPITLNLIREGAPCIVAGSHVMTAAGKTSKGSRHLLQVWLGALRN